VESVFTALNPTVAQHITNRCNPSQQAAVAAACAAAAIDSAKASGGFTLLQGPPGTGKTSVILHILNFLHLLQYQKYYERKLVELRSGGLQAAPAGGGAPADPATGEGASRKAGVESRDGGAFADILKGIASSSKQSLAGAVAKVPKKPRILVCAPSNAAVDVLVERLLRDRLRDANGFYTPDMIRVGSPSACSERIRVVTLDHQVEEILSRGGGGLEQAKARYRMLLDRREKLRGEAKGFEGELPRGMDGAIIETGQKIEAVQRDIKRLQIIANQKEGDSNEEIKDQLRAKLLEDAQIVFTTLNSSGQEFFARMANGFHTVIIDEACQAVEASTLIPLLLDVRRCILVGESVRGLCSSR
jgi:senataxin